MAEILEAVKQVGFPVIVATYLLLRLERTVKELHGTLGGLRNTLAVLAAPWNGVERRRTDFRDPRLRSASPAPSDR